MGNKLATAGAADYRRLDVYVIGSGCRLALTVKLQIYAMTAGITIETSRSKGRERHHTYTHH